MYKYLILTDGQMECFPSNSDNIKQHLTENRANHCSIYDNQGRLWKEAFITEEEINIYNLTLNTLKTEKFAKVLNDFKLLREAKN